MSLDTRENVKEIPYQHGELSISSDFFKLWAGETISFFGSQITVVAFPLIAISLLEASSKEVGFLNSLSYIPFLLFTLFAGIYVDRSTKRNIMIVSNFVRFLLLLILPISFWFHFLTLKLLYIIAFCTGVFTVFFDATFQTYIPFVVKKEQLVKANSRIMTSSSAAWVAGPGLGGYLVQLFGAAGAILLDALSYLISALFLLGIKTKEEKPSITGQKLHIKKDMLEGLTFVFKNRYIRSIMAEAATYNLCSQIFMTVLFLYAIKDLGLQASMIGIILTCGGLGSIVGSLIAEKVSTYFGIGMATISSMTIACTTLLLVPFAEAFTPYNLPIMFIGFFLNGLGLGLSNVTCTTIRQSIIPDYILARALAGSRLISWGATPIGAIIGGVLGDLIGYNETMIVGAIGLLFAPLWVIFSPLRHLE